MSLNEELKESIRQHQQSRELWETERLKLQDQIAELKELPIASDEKQQTLMRLIEKESALTKLLSTFNRELSLPVFPHIETDSHRLSITQNDNKIIIDPGQIFSIRGFKYDTSSFSESDRTFTCDAAKTYHLRFKENTFVFCDLADKAYNPDSLDEADEQFDSTYDDMLIARIKDNELLTLINASSYSVDIATTAGTTDKKVPNDWNPATATGEEAWINVRIPTAFARKPRIGIQGEGNTLEGYSTTSGSSEYYHLMLPHLDHRYVIYGCFAYEVAAQGGDGIFINLLASI